jgi:hypothetical protein
MNSSVGGGDDEQQRYARAAPLHHAVRAERTHAYLPAGTSRRRGV